MGQHMHDKGFADGSRDADEIAAPLDLLLSGSTMGMARHLLPNTSSSRLVSNLARKPRTVTSQTTGLVQELISIVRGNSEIAPAKGDKRFADAAWRANPFLKRTMQAYPATLHLHDGGHVGLHRAAIRSLTLWGGRP
jgi:poly[(R)-3-hydroxyalkanoate] polymerase subunit PhaC